MTKQKKSNAKLKKNLWKIFARWVKERDRWTCVTCGRKVDGYSANAGHYIAAGACGLEYYFSERNVHCQCTVCNLRLEGNRPAYRAFILSRYGETTLKDIETNYWKPCKDFPFEAKIAHYQALLEKL